MADWEKRLSKSDLDFIEKMKHEMEEQAKDPSYVPIEDMSEEELSAIADKMRRECLPGIPDIPYIKISN